MTLHVCLPSSIPAHSSSAPTSCHALYVATCYRSKPQIGLCYTRTHPPTPVEHRVMSSPCFQNKECNHSLDSQVNLGPLPSASPVISSLPSATQTA